MPEFVTNPGIQRAPNSCQFSRDTGRKSGESCILAEDKTKSTANVAVRAWDGSHGPVLAVIPGSLCTTHIFRWKGNWEWASSTPGLLRPQGPTRD